MNEIDYLLSQTANNINPCSALPEYMKPNVEMVGESNTILDKEKWVTIPVGPFIVAPGLLEKYGLEKDYPKTPELPTFGNGDCPYLAQNLIPNDELGVVANFVQGNVLYKGSEADRIAPVKGERYVEIKRGTVIFTPNSVGRYDNLKTGNHVAIFLSYGVYNSVAGIFVLDQYLRRKTNGKQTSGMRFLEAKSGPVGFRSENARAFAVVYSLKRVKVMFKGFKFPKIKIL